MSPHESPCQAAKRHRANRAMCVACEHTDRVHPDDWRKGAVLCVDGKPAVGHIHNSSCPLGRHMHPQTRQIDWMGVRWRGVPLPVRLWVWALHPRHPKPRTFEDCGCMHRLKSWWSLSRPWLQTAVIDLIVFLVLISLLGVIIYG